MTPAEILRLRFRAQGLAGPPARDVAEAVRRPAGIQAQVTQAARLAVRPRSAGLDAAAVTSACNEQRSVVRTWAMRGTLHMVPAEDVSWLVGLLGPVFAAAGRRRRLQLGLDDDVCARGLLAIRTVLADSGPLPRADLVQRLAGEGLLLDPKSQAPAHLVAYAALLGLVCRGPDRPDDEPTYVLLVDWVAAQPPREPDAALAELAHRYVRAFGPAEPEDFAAWSGLPRPRARRGFELAHVAPPEPPAEPGEPCVRLLPHFDTYLLGYRSRVPALAPELVRRINRGGGWISPTLVVDGRVVGTWRRERSGIEVEPFAPLDSGVLAGLDAEIADVGRFLG